jgi:protein-S-isoprenylcysteine O-methyltransferase Ste14
VSRVLARLIADAILVGAVLFTAAGTLTWWRGWVLLVVFFAIRAASAAIAYRVNPELLRERAALPLHADQSWTDKLLLVAVLATGYFGLPAIAGLDRFRWHVFRQPAVALSFVGLALFSFGWVIKGAALRANAFATTAVRWQRERNHAVVEVGPYRVVRHPFYAADPMIFVGLSLWLESYVAALCATIALALLLARLTLEERFLVETLPGYKDYMKRVPHRLIPGLW